MATLHLIQLKCVDKQTFIGKDKVNVYVHGDRVAGPLSPAKDEVAALTVTRSFDSSVDVELKEQDGSLGGENNDSMGVWTVKAQEAGAGNLTATFHRLKHADYHRLYRVTAD